MGTRGAICFVAGGQEKTVYNHFDSYPDALGETVAAWLRGVIGDRVGGNTESVNRQRVMDLQAIESDSEPTEAERERFKQYWNKNVSSGQDWYSLLRETQGEPALILQAQFYEDAGDFPKDSLFCEWAYVVDFDQRVFEIYAGFRTSPPTEGRWAGVKDVVKAASANYYPVQRIENYSFDELPAQGDVSKIDRSDDDE